jgi:hypothetical protein
MYIFEASCAVQVRAMAGAAGAADVMTKDLIPIDPRIIAGAMEQAKQATRSQGAGALAWPGLMRKLDRTDSSFRT